MLAGVLDAKTVNGHAHVVVVARHEFGVVYRRNQVGNAKPVGNAPHHNLAARANFKKVVLVVEIRFLQLNAGAVFENAVVDPIQACKQVSVLVIHAKFCTQARPRRGKIVRMLRLHGVIRIHEPVELERGILGDCRDSGRPNH